MVVSENRINSVINYVLENTNFKRRRFVENIDLFISLKNITNKKYKKISGIIKFPFQPKENLKVCVLADDIHSGECKNLGIYYLTTDKIRNLKTNKKLIKKLVKKFDKFLASDSIIKIIPRFLGPELTRYGKFPSPLSHTMNLKKQIQEVSYEKKIQFKKDNNSGITVGNINMKKQELKANINVFISFLISLLNKKTNLIKKIIIKRTMGTPFQLK